MTFYILMNNYIILIVFWLGRLIIWKSRCSNFITRLDFEFSRHQVTISAPDSSYNNTRNTALPNFRPWHCQMWHCQTAVRGIAMLGTAKLPYVALLNLAVQNFCTWHSQIRHGQTIVSGTAKFSYVTLPNFREWLYQIWQWWTTAHGRAKFLHMTLPDFALPN